MGDKNVNQFFEDYVANQRAANNINSVKAIPEEDYDDWSDEHAENIVEQLLSNIKFEDLTEGIKFRYDRMRPGDLYLVKRFTDLSTNRVVDNDEHRILLVSSVTANKAANNEYFGYYFTSNINQATVNNSKRQKMILIDNYDTILDEGEPSNRPVVINLGTVSSFKLADLGRDQYSYLGHVSDNFMAFIKDIVSGKIPDTTIWNKETMKKYN